ncbi:MAG: transcription termination factor NusA [Candidatus Acetothermia bacterium]
MNIDFIEALEDMAKDKGIERDELYSMVEKGLQAAYQEQYDTNRDVDVNIDQNSGDIFIEGEQIQLGQFGRIASKKAEDVIRQLIREKQNELVYESYEKRKGEVVNGSIHRFEGSDVWLNLGEVEGLLPSSERIPGERYDQGDSLRAYLYYVDKKPGGLDLRVSRTKKKFVAKLMEIEIPEIEDELLEIVEIAREPGKRSKVAVRSLDDQIDPVGTCVGAGGSRVKEVTDELNGEKIDVIHWSDDRERLIKNSLEPASVLSIEFQENEQGEEIARVIVPKDDLAYAIGQNGQNVRLTVDLVGCDIDVRSPGSEE